jgi:hypothetical protein
MTDPNSLAHRDRGNPTQQWRRKCLRALMDDYRCWPFDHPGGAKLRDYDDAYAELAATYLGVKVEADGNETPVDVEGVQAVPRYACIKGDETYSMIELSDTLSEGVDTVTGGIGNDTLMNPERIIDLETGAEVPFRVIGLSEEAFTVLCGLVQPSWMEANTPEDEALAVNRAGIYTDCWDELRAKFPLEHFRKAAHSRGEDFYHEEAGT